MVGNRRGAAQGELGQADRRGDADILDGDARPDRVELLEPGEQVAAGGTTAGEPLVEVVVGVDQPGGDDATFAGDHLVPRPRSDGPYLGDDSALDCHLAGPAAPRRTFRVVTPFGTVRHDNLSTAKKPP